MNSWCACLFARRTFLLTDLVGLCELCRMARYKFNYWQGCKCRTRKASVQPLDRILLYSTGSQRWWQMSARYATARVSQPGPASVLGRSGGRRGSDQSPAMRAATRMRCPAGRRSWVSWPRLALQASHFLVHRRIWPLKSRSWGASSRENSTWRRSSTACRACVLHRQIRTKPLRRLSWQLSGVPHSWSGGQLGTTRSYVPLLILIMPWLL